MCKILEKSSDSKNNVIGDFEAMAQLRVGASTKFEQTETVSTLSLSLSLFLSQRYMLIILCFADENDETNSMCESKRRKLFVNKGAINFRF